VNALPPWAVALAFLAMALLIAALATTAALQF
jgi:hypothetical protein